MSQTAELTVKSKNIQLSLAQYAQDNALGIKNCDFTLKKLEFFVRDVHNKEFLLITKERLEPYLQREKIVDEHIEFSQLYTITLHSKTKSRIELVYKIKEGELSYEPKIIISPKSVFPTKTLIPKEMLRLLYKELNKIKLLHGFIINIFDLEMKKNLQSFIKYLYADKFTKNLQITLFSGIIPTIAQESKLHFLYKQKENSSQVIEVNSGEVLIEYQKPIYGKNGLDAYGKEISMNSKNNSNDLELNIDSKTIIIDEDEYSKKYISKVQGFVHLHKNTLSIDNKIKLSTISRNTTSVASEEDNNIEIIISQHDNNKDSIGEGVELVSESIYVDGFVGAKSKLEATTLTIAGATHQDSMQVAKYATINRHKGKLRCHEAKITLLEGGEVIASKVDIESSLGGSIYAMDVTIGHVKNHLKVYASNSITIRLVSGEDNRFTIDLHKVPIVESKLNFIQKDIEDLKDTLEEAKQYKPHKVTELQKKIKKFTDERENILNSYKNAFITIQKPVAGLNHITFRIDKENELTYKTEIQSYETFHLEIDETKITLLPINKSITIE